MERSSQAFTRWFAWVAALLSLACILPHQVWAQDSGLSRLGEIWAGQRSDVATAYIRARVANTGDVRPLSPERVAAVLTSARLDENADRMRDVVRAVFANPPAMDRPWSTIEFWSEGSKTRQDGFTGSRLHGSRVFDGKADANFNPANRHIQLHAAGGSNVFRRGLDSFRFVPDTPSDAKVSPLKGELVALERDGLRAEVNSNTGFVHLWSMKDASGMVAKAIYQGGPVTYPNGLVFPTYVAIGDYGGGTLRFFMVTVIEKAQFNQPIPSEKFALAAGPGTAVYDRRVSGERMRYARVREATKDVVDYIDSRTNITTVTSEERTAADRELLGGKPGAGLTSYLFYISLVVGAVLALGGLIYLLRKRAPGPSS